MVCEMVEGEYDGEECGYEDQQTNGDDSAYIDQLGFGEVLGSANADECAEPYEHTGNFCDCN